MSARSKNCEWCGCRLTGNRSTQKTCNDKSTCRVYKRERREPPTECNVCGGALAPGRDPKYRNQDCDRCVELAQLGIVASDPYLKDPPKLEGIGVGGERGVAEHLRCSCAGRPFIYWDGEDPVCSACGKYVGARLRPPKREIDPRYKGLEECFRNDFRGADPIGCGRDPQPAIGVCGGGRQRLALDPDSNEQARASIWVTPEHSRWEGKTYIGVGSGLRTRTAPPEGVPADPKDVRTCCACGMGLPYRYPSGLATCPSCRKGEELRGGTAVVPTVSEARWDEASRWARNSESQGDIGRKQILGTAPRPHETSKISEPRWDEGAARDKRPKASGANPARNGDLQASLEKLDGVDWTLEKARARKEANANRRALGVPGEVAA